MKTKKVLKIFTTVLFIMFILVGSASTCPDGHGNSNGSTGDTGHGNSDGSDGNSSDDGDSSSPSASPSSATPSPSPSPSPSVGNSSNADIDGGIGVDPADFLPTVEPNCWIVTNGWCVNIIAPGVWSVKGHPRGEIWYKK